MGQNQVILGHQIIHFPKSSGVIERASEQMSAAMRSKAQQSALARRALWNKRMGEQCERTSEQASEWTNTSRFMAVLNHTATGNENMQIAIGHCEHF